MLEIGHRINDEFLLLVGKVDVVEEDPWDSAVPALALSERREVITSESRFTMSAADKNEVGLLKGLGLEWVIVGDQKLSVYSS